jgi:hypothetical protein
VSSFVRGQDNGFWQGLEEAVKELVSIYSDRDGYNPGLERRLMPLWVPEWVVGVAGRLTCRLLRWHNITCRGRPDHTAHEAVGVSLIDPDRWNRWPHR